MFAHLGAAHGDPDFIGPIGQSRDLMGACDMLDINQVIRADNIGAKLHQHIRAPGEKAGNAGRMTGNINGLRE